MTITASEPEAEAARPAAETPVSARVEVQAEAEAAEGRPAFLNREPAVLGASWARTWIENLRADDRPIRGGWPGTLPEARHRASQHFTRELLRRGMSSLTTAELAAATMSMYQRAKKDWLDAVRANEFPRSRERAQGRSS